MRGKIAIRRQSDATRYSLTLALLAALLIGWETTSSASLSTAECPGSVSTQRVFGSTSTSTPEALPS